MCEKICNSAHSGPEGQGNTCVKKCSSLSTVVLKGKGTIEGKNLQFCSQWSSRARGQICEKICNSVHSGPQGQRYKCVKKCAILSTVVLKGKGTNV